jgi:hypothetical protein
MYCINICLDEIVITKQNVTQTHLPSHLRTCFVFNLFSYNEFLTNNSSRINFLIMFL